MRRDGSSTIAPVKSHGVSLTQICCLQATTHGELQYHLVLVQCRQWCLPQGRVPLLQATAHGELLYKSVPHWCLQWEYRWPGLLAEIRHYQPDVMSLQEVDHMDELEAALGPLG